MAAKKLKTAKKSKTNVNYEKATVLFDLAQEMQADSAGMSLDDIAEKLKVSRRTAERMRDAIVKYFPDATIANPGERVKRWKIPQSPYNLNSLISFTPEELSVFKTAAELLKINGLDEKADIMDKVRNKLINLFKPRQKAKMESDIEGLINAEGLVLRPGPQIHIDGNILGTLREAINSFHYVKMKYQSKLNGKVRSYTVIPCGFLYGQRDHYLVARYDDKGKAYNFSLQYIKEVEILPATFDSKQFDLHKYAKQAFGAFHEGKMYEVEWLFSAKAATEAKNFIFHPTQKLIENEDGTLTVKFKASGRLEMDWFLYTWGDDVKVIKPTDWYTASKIVDTEK